MNFNTSYVEKETDIIDDYWKISKNYMKCWLWIDLLATIPFTKMLVSFS